MLHLHDLSKYTCDTIYIIILLIRMKVPGHPQLQQ